MVVFGLKLTAEPASEIVHGLCHGLVGVLGRRLPGRAVASDVHGHGIFVVVSAAVADPGSKPVEVPALDGLQSVGNVMQRGIPWGVVPDACGCSLGVANLALKAGPIAMAREPGEADAGLSVLT